MLRSVGMLSMPEHRCGRLKELLALLDGVKVVDWAKDVFISRSWVGDGNGETHGRKLQAVDGRFATKVKISEIRRCLTSVSYR